MPRDMTLPAAPPKFQNHRLLWRLARGYLLPHGGKLALSLVFMAVAALMTAAIAQLMQPVLDDVLSGGRTEMIYPVAVAAFLVFVVRSICTYLSTIMTNKIGQSIVADIQRGLFSHLLNLDLAFFGANPSGQLLSRVVFDVNVMRIAVTESFTGFGKHFLTLVFLIGVMFYQDWKLSLAAFTIFPFASAMVMYLGKKLRRISVSIQQDTGGLSDMLSQIFQGIRQVQAYGMEDYERARAAKAIERVKRLNIKSVRVGNMMTPVNDMLIGLVLLGIIIYGGHEAAAGTMTAGQLGAFLAAFMMAYEPMKKMARLNATVQTGLGAADRFFEIMDLTPSIRDAAKDAEFAAKNPRVSFENVEFQYGQGDIKALNGVSFTAEPGQVTALVGPSGGGKTTIINMIPRFYDPVKGRVAIDGTDLREINLISLRRNIALVSQDITIFDDSIAANIAYGSQGADRKDIEEAARRAAAHDFIMAMPEGYETKVGEDGLKLSGGQRQRIALARAMLRNAPILLLDEATSALDNESEKAVQEALRELEKGRTTIVIAHRLSTVRAADKIIVLDSGGIAETGKHEDLLARNGLYARMYQSGLRE